MSRSGSPLQALGGRLGLAALLSGLSAVLLVVLSGAGDPDRTGPLTENSTVLIDRSLPCVPCRDRICRRGDMLCMSNLTVSSVIAAVGERLGQTERTQRGIALPVIRR